jgi:hypothetical protein
MRSRDVMGRTSCDRRELTPWAAGRKARRAEERGAASEIEGREIHLMANSGSPNQTQPGGPPKPKPLADLAKRVLEENRRFEVVLEDGQTWACKLVEWGQYDLLVETSEGLVLLPKHSIHHIVIERKEA